MPRKKKIIKPDHISFSQINTGRCPYAYLKIRLLGEVKNDGQQLQAGKCMHDIIEQYTKYCFDHDLDGDSEAMIAIVDKCITNYSLDPQEYNAIHDSAEMFGMRDLDFETIYEFENEQRIEFEQGKIFTAKLDNLRFYVNEKSIPCLDVIDYKHSLKMFTQKDVEKHLQLLCYVNVACNWIVPEAVNVRWGVHNTRYNQIVWSQYHKVKDMHTTFNRIDQFWSTQWDRLIERDEYEPQHGAQCWEYGGCPVMLEGKCPHYKKRELKRLMVGDMTAQARAMIAMDNMQAKTKERLKKQLENTSPVIVDDREIGYVKSESYHYDLSRFIDYAVKNNIRLDGIKISKEEAERAITKKKIKMMMPEQIEELEEIKVKKTTTKFIY